MLSNKTNTNCSFNNRIFPVLGIDVGKSELVIFDNQKGRTLSLANTNSALEEQLKQENWLKKAYVVGFESTGDYSLTVAQFFLNKGFKVKMINPIVTKRFIKSTIRSKKTDKSDAQIIAEIVLSGQGQEMSLNELKLAKKALIRTEQKLTQIEADLKRLKSSLVAKSAIDKQTKSLNQAVNEITRLINEIDQSKSKIWQLSKAENQDKQEEIIASHPGCGEKLSAIISTEAGNIKRFPAAAQFKAYAGIDPKVIQSGQKDVRGKMTKRGNPNLRHALYLASFVASRCDPELKAYYHKKRSEGKSHTHAVCAVARKMCERIYATVTQDRMYQVVKEQDLT